MKYTFVIHGRCQFNSKFKVISQNNGPRIFLNLDLANTQHGHALLVNKTKKRGGRGGVKPKTYLGDMKGDQLGGHLMVDPIFNFGFDQLVELIPLSLESLQIINFIIVEIPLKNRWKNYAAS